VETLKRSLIPLALVVTPNLHEAETLTGRPVRSPAEMREAARIIFDLGPRFVLVKGGHLPDRALDILFDGNEYRELAAEKIPTVHTHGSGCTFSAAIAAGLAVGKDLVTAATEAKRYVTEAIRFGYALGQGCGPLNQLWKQRAMAG
jgi:hydroxymethylpyrimidine/phosphomethylpyrimidine kinase